MISFRSMTFPLFALVAALAGCTAETGSSTGAASADDVRASAEAAQVDDAVGSEGHVDRARFQHVRPGGPDFLVQAALRAPIQLTPEQKATIEGLAKVDAPRAHAFDPARRAKLAAAIRSNSVEALEVPAFDASGREARLAASAKALATLHDTLTPEQRVALVDGIAKHAAEHAPRREGLEAERGDRGERGPRAGGAKALRHPGGFDGGPMHLLAGLDLTQAQKDAIKTKLEAERPAKPSEEQREAMKAKFASMRAEMQAKLESFKGNDFDATAFVTPPADLARPDTAARRPNQLAIVTSVLTPAQREALATRLEQGPSKSGARVKAPREHRRTAQ